MEQMTLPLTSSGFYQILITDNTVNDKNKTWILVLFCAVLYMPRHGKWVETQDASFMKY